MTYSLYSIGQVSYVKETFNTSNISSNIIYGGDAKIIQNDQKLNNKGSLMLTSDEESNGGFMYINLPMALSKGVYIDFEYASWSNKNISEGLSVFLFEANRDFLLGSALGYASYKNEVGLNGGVVGIAFDEKGLFSTRKGFDGNSGISDKNIPNSISIRGPYNGIPAYPYIGGTGIELSGSVLSETTIGYSKPTNTKPDESEYYRRANIFIEPVSGGINVTVSVFTEENKRFEKVLGPLFVATEYNKDIKIGFAASNLGSLTTHEIRNIVCSSLENNSVVASALTPAINGLDYSYEIDVLSLSNKNNNSILKQVLPNNFKLSKVELLSSSNNSSAVIPSNLNEDILLNLPAVSLSKGIASILKFKVTGSFDIPNCDINNNEKIEISIIPYKGESYIYDNFCSIENKVEFLDLSVSHQNYTKNVKVGQLANFDIQVSNLSTNNLLSKDYNIKVLYKLDSSFTYNSVYSDNNVWKYEGKDDKGNLVFYTKDNLASGASLPLLQIKATLENIVSDNQVNNTASLEIGKNGCDAINKNNTSVVYVNIGDSAGDIDWVLSSVLPIEKYFVGRSSRCVLKVTNGSLTTLAKAGLLVSNRLPKGVGYKSITATKTANAKSGDINISSNRDSVSISGIEIPANTNDYVEYTIIFDFSEDVETEKIPLNWNISSNGQLDLNTTNNKINNTALFAEATDLAVKTFTNTASAGSAYERCEPITYNITITNKGPVTLSAGYELTLNLPQEVSFVESLDGGFYDALNHVVIWNDSNPFVFPSDISKAVTVKVNDNVASEIGTAEASVWGASGASENYPTDNTKTIGVLPVVANPDFTMTYTGNNPTCAGNGGFLIFECLTPGVLPLTIVYSDGTNTKEVYMPSTILEQVKPMVTTTYTMISATSINTGYCINVDDVPPITVSVIAEIVGNVIVSPGDVCEGQDPGVITGDVPYIGGASFTYQWQQSTGSSGFNDIAGATGQNYDPPVLTVPTTYKRVVTSGACSYNSNEVTISTAPIVDVESLEHNIIEGNSTLFVNIEFPFSAPLACDVGFTFSALNGSAINGDDFTFMGSTITAPAGATSVIVSVLINGDNVIEPDEYFGIAISSTSSAVNIGGEGIANCFIINDDGVPNVSITPTVTRSEGDGQMIFYVNLNMASSTDITIDYNVSSITAQENVDFSMASTDRQLVILAGETSKEIVVNLIDDQLLESTEEFSIEISESSGTIPITNGIGSGFISDNDVVQLLDVRPVENLEEGGVANFEFFIASPSPQDISFNFKTGYSLSPDQAVPVDDFEEINKLYTIPAGQTSIIVPVQTVDDDIFEPIESFYITLSNIQNAYVNQVIYNVAIYDNEGEPKVYISTVDIPEGSSGLQNKNITFIISPRNSKDTYVNYRTVAKTAVGSNAPDAYGSDYVDIEGTFIIPAESYSADLPIGINGDAIFEGVEHFDVELSNQQPANVILPKTVYPIYIADDDTRPGLIVDDYQVFEGQGSAYIPVHLSAVSNDIITVNYSFADNSAISGSDYTTSTGTITFDPGEKEGYITVNIVDDSIFESLEDFKVLLSSPTNAILNKSEAIISIEDNDDPSTVYLVLNDNSSVEGNEGTITPVQYSLSLSAAATVKTNIDYELISCANFGATSDEDFIALSGSAFISVGQTGVIVSAEIIGDNISEENECFRISIKRIYDDSNNDLPIIVRGNGATTIINDDVMPVVSILEPNFSPIEGNSGSTIVNVTLQLSAISHTDVNIVCGTNDGSAISTPISIFTADYISNNGVVTIPKNVTSVVVPISINGDNIHENNETFKFVLVSAENASIGSKNQVPINIMTDDFPPSISFADAELEEPTVPTDMQFMATITGLTELPISFNAVTSDISTTQDLDYVSFSGTAGGVLGWTNPAPVPITILPDDISEPTEEFNLKISAVQGAQLKVNNKPSSTCTLIGKIIEPVEVPVLSLAFQDVSIDEGASSLLVANLTSPLSTDISIPLDKSGTAKINEDYTLASSIVIKAGSTTNNVELFALTDALVELDENVDISVSQVYGGNVTIDPTVASLMIVDANPVPVVTLYAKQDTLSEGRIEPEMFWAQISSLTYEDVVITIGWFPTSMAKPEDYVLGGTTLTIPAGQTSSNLISLEAIHDSEVEVYKEPLTLTVNSIIGGEATITEQQLVTVNIIDIDQSPDQSKFEITLNEDQVYTFNINDFVFESIDVTTVASVFIEQSVDFSLGSLVFDGQKVVSQTNIPAADISKMTYTPNENANGVPYDSMLRYSLIDVDGNKSLYVFPLTINVLAVNDAPQGRSVSYTMDEDGAPLEVMNLPVTDVEGDLFVNYVKDNVNNGSLFSLNNGNGFKYQPNMNFNGVDSFTYYPSDYKDEGLVDTVTINVRPKNDPPTSSKQYIETNVNVPYSGDVYVDDVDGDVLVYETNMEPAYGFLELMPDGSFVYTPNPGFVGVDNFVFRVTDIAGAYVDAVYEITVIAQNQPPQGCNLQVSTSMGTQIIVNVVNCASDPEGGPVNVDRIIVGPKNGISSIKGTTSISYIPNNQYVGADTVYFSLIDNAGMHNRSNPYYLAINVYEEYVDVKITKTASVETIAKEELYKYLIKVENISPDAATARKVVVTDTLDTNIKIQNIGGGTWNPSNNSIKWNIDSLMSGETKDIEFSVIVKTSFVGDSVHNSATVKTSQLDFNYKDNTSKISIPFGKSSLDFVIPKVFTPNGDGINDRWEFATKNLSSLNVKLVIVDRTGMEVYKSYPYNNDWNGSGLAEGTYFYLATYNNEVTGEEIVRKGYVTIIK